MVNRLLKKFQEYLHDSLSIQVSLQRWEGSQKLPLLLREFYEYHETTILHEQCLVMLPKNSEGVTPAKISKHMEHIRKIHTGLPIYVTESLSPFNRSRLIQHKVPFVVPWNQMYLPFLGLDLREHYTNTRRRQIDGLTPSAQAVIIWMLYQEKMDQFSVPQLAQVFAYSTMTISRTFDELEALSIVESRKIGRKRILCTSMPRKKIWETTREYLLSPVKDRRYLTKLSPSRDGISAGLSALAEYTMIAEPLNPVYACTLDEWNVMLDDPGVEVLPEADPGGIEIEIWTYDPRICAKNALADPLSLYVSLQGSPDERIESALQELTREFPW
jgi:hypothetical protein